MQLTIFAVSTLLVNLLPASPQPDFNIHSFFLHWMHLKKDPSFSWQTQDYDVMISKSQLYKYKKMTTNTAIKLWQLNLPLFVSNKSSLRELDHAMLRRLEKRILVSLPSSPARQAMISHWLPPLSCTGGVELRTLLDYEALAKVRMEFVKCLIVMLNNFSVINIS